MQAPDTPVTIVGAGLAGTLLALLLARRSIPVLLLERRPDPRVDRPESGRSINLALAARGIAALRQAGAFEAIEHLLLPMPGRMLHAPDGGTQFIPYGQGAAESIWSVGRNELNCALLDELAKHPRVVMAFGQACAGFDAGRRSLLLKDAATGQSWRVPLERVVGADGAGSPLRHSLMAASGLVADEDFLPHGYKELLLPADARGSHQFDPGALHIWPRGGFMLIGLPNTDGSFTLTLFLPLAGPDSFAALTDGRHLRAFFEAHFPDVLELLPALEEEFAAHPTGRMGTVRCPRWTDGERIVLIGDAAHAIVPFHGQGMNCAFEDCVALDALLAERPWGEACSAFEKQRRPDAEAIAAMALENYVEMRDTVRDPRFQLQKALSLELERRFPERFVPRYSMVMFHPEIPYRIALERGAVQATLLDELTRDASTLEGVDFAAAERLVTARLPPYPTRSSSSKL